MTVCIINVNDYFLYMSIKKIIENIFNKITLNRELKTYQVCKSSYDIIFIEPENMTISAFVAILKSIQLGIAVFIISSHKLNDEFINLAKKYNATILLEEDPSEIVKYKIEKGIKTILGDKLNPAIGLSFLSLKKFIHHKKCNIYPINSNVTKRSSLPCFHEDI
ncbi:hypothetical protein [Yersinia sp. 22-579]|uniref:hypothetical protein n=1 Tax=Yersinia sp. 22-579 TaxID=3057580 RepID=UPI00263AE352|nr:hypothetical protein [Yersinia sp. 22-579]